MILDTKGQVYSIAIVALFLFSIITLARLIVPFVDVLDVALIKCIINFRNDTFSEIVVGITNIVNLPVIILITILISAILLAAQKRFSSFLCVSSLCVGLVLLIAFKNIFEFQRPSDALINVAGFGFPSGHATIATIFFLFIAYLFKQTSHRKIFRALFYSVIICMMGTVGLSRIYLGVHFPSDVVGGYALGTFSFFITYALTSSFYVRKNTRR